MTLRLFFCTLYLMSQKSRKTALFFLFVLGFFSLATAQKVSMYTRVGSTGIIKKTLNEGDATFGGMYALFYGSVTLANATVVVKTRIKLSETAAWNELKTSAVLEKAYMGFDMPFLPELRVYGGKGYALTLPGGFFTLPELYGAGVRWGKDGIALNYRKGGLSCGANFTSTTTATNLSEALQFGMGASFDFAAQGLSVPLAIGVSALYDNALGGSSAGEAKDWTCAFFAQFKPKSEKDTFVSGLSVGAGYCINGSTMTSNATYKYVENYDTFKTKALSYTHIFTLISKAKIGSVSVEEEAEWGTAFDEPYYSVYGGLRLKIPVTEILRLWPTAQYYCIFNGDDSSKSRDSLVLCPRVVAEKGHHLFSMGAVFEHRETGADTYCWNLKIPFYYKYTL